MSFPTFDAAIRFMDTASVDSRFVSLTEIITQRIDHSQRAIDSLYLKVLEQ